MSLDSCAACLSMLFATLIGANKDHKITYVLEYEHALLVLDCTMLIKTWTGNPYFSFYEG